MREIKFRVFFYDASDFSTGEMMAGHDAFCENYIDWSDGCLKASDECSVLMQYTGLKDKNGKEIYEGDIIKFDNTAQILWLPIVFEPFLGYRLYQNEHRNYRFYPEISEVIGNIYENPELLK